YVLIGDPPQAMNNAITVAVLANGVTVDSAAVNAGATSQVDETASRFPDGTDTDAPDDFWPVTATPGRSNGELCAVAAAVINEVATDPQQDWNHTLSESGSPFDGTAGTGDVTEDDEYLEIKNTSGAAADFTNCALTMADNTPERLLLQPFDAAESPYVRVFDADGTPLGGATAIADVPAGGYILIGD